MKLRFIHAEKLDKLEWDNRVYQSACKVPYVLSSWLDDFGKRNWFLVEDEHSSLAFPIVLRVKWGLEFVYQPYFTQQLGWLPEQKLTEQEVQSIFKQLKRKFWIVHYHLNAETLIKQELEGCVMKRNYWLQKEEFAMNYRAFSENHRRNIKKAEKAQLYIDPTITAAQVIDLFKKDRGNEMKHIRDVDYAPFIQNVQRVNPFYKWQMIGVRNIQSELIAAAGWSIYKGRHIFAASGNSKEGKQKGAMAFLIARYLEGFMKNGEVLDFEGSMNEGVGRFYAGFGSNVEYYPSIYLERMKGLRRIIR